MRPQLSYHCSDCAPNHEDRTMRGTFLTFWLASGSSDCPMPDGPHHAKLKSKNWGPRIRSPDVVSTKGQHLSRFQAKAPSRAFWEATRT